MNETYFPRVVQAISGADCTVYAYFDDGAIRCLDVKPMIEQGGIFDRLREPDFFESRLTVMNDTVAWDLSGRHDPAECIDIDPFTVYEAPAAADPLESAV